MKGKCKLKGSCKYSVAVSQNYSGGQRICGYLLITGKPRECPADACDKYIEDKVRRPRRKGIKL